MTEANPPDKSFDPYNDYQFRCEPTKQKVTYKMCLNIIQAFESGSDHVFESCRKCLVGFKCPAVVMRAEEADKNQSIYYSESPLRSIHQRADDPAAVSVRKPPKVKSPSYIRGEQQVMGIKRLMKKPVTKTVVHKGEPAVSKIESPKNADKPLPGESMFDYITRLRSSKNGNRDS